jgi:hypothetical protein
MNLVKGENLTPKQLSEVKARYIYRHLAIGADKYYPNEQAWINDHAFYVRKDGTLSNLHKHCESACMVP